MTTMPRNRALSRATLAAVGVLLASSWAAPGSPCPPDKPVLSGPAVVNRFEGYTISWTNVLVSRPSGPADIFVVERSEDPRFLDGVERFQTNRTSASFGAPLGVPRTLYHRVGVQSFCAGTTAVRSDSDLLAVGVVAACPAPIELAPPVISPAAPPALTTYVVSWDTLGAGEPGPGGGAQGLRFRLRRASAGEVKETLIDGGSAAFADVPGEFHYQVRTENLCGEASAWSPPSRVVVGESKTEALVLVSAPRPVLVAAGSSPSVPLVVRNAGSEPLEIEARGPAGVLEASPAAFRLAPGESRAVGVAVVAPLDPAAPLHSAVTFEAAGIFLRVPIDVGVAGETASVPVGWDEDGADVDRAGNGIRRTLVNAGSRPASIVTSVSADWIRVLALDGTVWDRPLAPGERRAVWVNVDRSRRRAAIGTEVATVTVVTSGHPDSPKSLSVIDDGPLVTGWGAPNAADDLPPLYLMKSRLLFPSLPNVVDALGVGRYTSDVWLSNVDALSPIKVVMTLTPAGQGNTSAGIRQFVFSLAPGETRRFRNVLGTVFGYEGACSLDISSPAATLSATAMVNNKPITPLVAGKTAALGTAIEGTILSNAEFGFEMRPVAPGEGANGFDLTYVVSGLWHDARRRTNLILRETTGNQTVVRVELFDSGGNPVLKGGAPVRFEITVPALGSLQVNDADLFPPEALTGSAWARVTFLQGVIDPFGRNRGAVVPFATVIDSGTQDASLRVGVSTKSLVPAQAEPPALRALASEGPFAGEAESLFFPVARVSGAPLASGRPPTWRTRVTFANVNRSEQRTLKVFFHDKSGQGASAGPFPIGLGPGGAVHYDDLLSGFFFLPSDKPAWGVVEVVNEGRTVDGKWEFTWTGVDVQTETYTADTENPSNGEFRTGMEAYSYQHGYSSFQSNLGTVLIDGAETSPRNRTNLILQEVGGALCDVAIGVYRPGILVPIAVKNVTLQPGDYISRELFRDLMGLDLEEIVDARVVVRQLGGDGVFMAFVSKINLVTGDPANVFLRPASAGTGR
jgi:hypothetical protein